MRRRTTATASVLFVCATTALTACSSSGSPTASAKNSPAASSPAAPAKPKGPFADRTAGQVFTDAVKANRQASSLRLKADIADATDGPTKLDLLMDTKGDCTGTIGSGKDAVSLIKTGKTVYMHQANTHTWSKSDTTSANGKDLASVCDLNDYLTDPGQDNAATKGATTTVDGRPALVLTEKDGNESYTIDVATTGKPYLLKMVTVGGDSPGTLAFSDFDKPVHAVAPPKSAITAG
ncbi:hypothetical protein DWB77_04567 [Streptomyces hundungensis]|uniref:Lipoprotein n=1 Tax=Streptomyces hundungensis TaxID=1077946 RepID=A0A387HJF1_9ACTN|nr:hypothetical protein [Streptomyces hundungensis]AYG82393.1 hypothetical protein DWB77_04567 [Streptomyces hundungensis]